MKILLAPDKFKGTYTAVEVCSLLCQGLSDQQIIEHPMADGGDGTALLLAEHRKAVVLSSRVSGPLGKPLNAHWGWHEKQKTAYLDMAEAAGLRHLKPDEYQPMDTTTLGVGELIRKATLKGARKIYLGVGGSATNDGGCGALVALGFRFMNAHKEAFVPTGGNLCQICAIQVPEAGFPLIEILCDVSSPFYGGQGAAITFATQKGARQQQIIELEAGMCHLARLWQKTCGQEMKRMAGSGAAGGLAGGLHCGLKAKLLAGAACYARLTKLNNKIQQADLIISGEGKLDASSLRGKVVGYLARKAQKLHTPFWVLCGTNQLPENETKAAGIDRVISLYPPKSADFSDTDKRMQQAVKLLAVQIKRRFT